MISHFLAEVRPNGRFVEFAPWYVIAIVGAVIFSLGIVFVFGKEEEDRQARRALRGVGCALMIGGCILIAYGLLA